MTLLCLDAGNTRLKWGLRGERGWLAQGALDPGEIIDLTALLPIPADRILACNVAGATVAARIEELAAALGTPLEWFVSATSCRGVTNGYANPERLGADRWAALVGAHGLLGHRCGPALVVMAGTATTIDVLTADGCFQGGLILPGLELMRQALARNTAGLPEAHGTYRALPTNTDDAIESGILYATLGAIERMARQLPGEGTLCLLSGGAAAALAPFIELPLRVVDNLVLEGLALAGS